MIDRFKQVQIDLVDAMWRASGCSIDFCTSPGCGHFDIERMFGKLGIEWNDDGLGHRFTEMAQKISSFDFNQPTILMMLDSIVQDGNLKNEQILRGFMEVPEPVGNLLWDQGWNERLTEAEAATPWVREATNKEFLYELVRLAFPVEYLVEAEDIGVDGVVRGQVALQHMIRTFAENSMTSPLVPSHLLTSLIGYENDWCWKARSPWDSFTCYMLGMGEDDRVPSDYLNEGDGDYFMCAHRGHGINSFGLGIIARFGGVFISQQTGYGGVYMENANEYVDAHMKAYNTHIAPLETRSSALDTGIVFSDYRVDATIFTTDSRAFGNYETGNSWKSWDLPDGWGIAVDRFSILDMEFEPRLRELIASNYSPQLTAAAKYLLEVTSFDAG